MSVLCSGNARILESLGEKQDFEAELSRRGFRHEEFTLHVQPGGGKATGAGWNPRYEVGVTHLPTQTVKVYAGGPRESWVARFTRDLADGRYGEPNASSVALAPARHEHRRA